MNTTTRNRPSGRLGLLLSLAIFAVATTGCVTNSAWAQTYFPPTNAPDNWRSLIPGPNIEPSQGEKDTIATTVGLDWDQLEVAYLYSRGFNPGAEVLMIKDGWVVWAWTGGSNFLQETSGASMTKSATALAYAHLFDQNPAIGPESFASDHLSNGAAWVAGDPTRGDIRIRHLLTMNSGIQPHDDPAGPTYTVDFIRNRPMQDAPGDVWAYSSLGVDLAGIILQETTSQELSDYANQNLFNPIGAGFTWEQIEGTIDKASTNMRGNVYDWARFGYLLMNGGNWDGNQIVSQQNVDLITTPAPELAGAQFQTTPGSPFVVPTQSQDHYGYLIWTNATGVGLGSDVPTDAYFAYGFGEDLTIVVPSLSLIVVRLGDLPTGQDAVDFRSEFMSRIMQAVITPANNPPQFTSSPVTAATQDQTYTYNVVATDPDPGDTLTITAPTIPSWLSLSPTGNGTATLTGTPSNADVGNHAVSLRVTDGTSNVTQNFTVVVSDVNEAPNFQSVPVTAATEGQVYTYNISASDPDAGDTLTITAPTLPSWLALNSTGNGTATLTGTPGAGDVGVNSVELEVEDAGMLSDTQSFDITVAGINGAPSFTSSPLTGITEGVEYLYGITTDDPDGDPVTIAATTLPAWLQFVDNGDGTAELRGTPNGANIGTHPVSLSVTDDAMATGAPQSFNITVTDAGEGPVITLLGDNPVTVNVGDGYTDEGATASDPQDGDLTADIVVNNPVDADTPGTYTVTYSVSDTAGNAVQAQRTVEVVNVAPMFTSSPVTTATVDEGYSYDISTTDPSDAVSLSAPAMPNWLTFTDNGDGTARLSGTPRAGDVGDANVTIEANDGVNAAVEQSFTLTVSDATPPPPPPSSGGGGGGGSAGWLSLILAGLLYRRRTRR